MLTAFHGTTARFDRFQPSERGSFGSGVYFGSEKLARIYAENHDTGAILECRLCLQNPYVYFASENEDYDLDSMAVNLLLELFVPPMAEELIRESASQDAMFGREPQQMLEEMEHDGLVVIYEDGSSEYIVFDTSKIEIVGSAPDSETASAASGEKCLWVGNGSEAAPDMVVLADVNSFLCERVGALTGRERERCQRAIANLFLLLADDGKNSEGGFCSIMKSSVRELLNRLWRDVEAAEALCRRLQGMAELREDSDLAQEAVPCVVCRACPFFCVNGFQVKAGRGARRTRW